MAEQSQFREISIGTVAENKLRTSNEIEIWLEEFHPLVDGEVVGGYNEDSIDCTNVYGDRLSFSVKLSNTVTATWRGDGTNRYTAPDVRRGEQVRVFQFGDTDKYVWEVVNGPGETTRKRETVITVFSNTADENDNQATPENSWYQEVNTHEKHITTKTNKNDGEPYAYTQQINAKEGNVVVVADDIGNYIQLNSSEQHIELETAAGARVELLKEDVIITCRNYIVKASNQITMNAKTGAVTIPETTWTGNISQKGNLSITGNMVGMAGGTYTFNGKTITNGELTNNGKNVGDSHKHLGVNTGNGTSGTVS